MDEAAHLHVVVLDDDPGWTAAARAVLERVGRPLVEASTGEQARDLIDSHGASLLVVGPGSASDLEWVRGVRNEGDLLHVVVVVKEADAEIAGAAFASGATAVISDSFSTGNLASAVTLAAAGAAPTDRYGLSDRELELLGFVTRGASNAQIAKALWISDQTVKFHLSRIYRKLGVSSRTEAAWVARSQGLVDDAPASAGQSPGS